MKQIATKKLFLSFFINLAIVVLEIIGLVLSVQRHGKNVFQYFTENSNYFALIVSVIFCIGCIFAVKNKTNVAHFICVLRYVSTVCLTVTITVVLFVLIPMFPSTFLFMMFQTSNLYQHFLCPVLSIVSLLFLENQQKLYSSAIFYAIIPTLVYGTILISLNLLEIISGPYPFFYFYLVPWYVSVFGCLGVFLGSVLIAVLLFFVYNKPQQSHSKKFVNQKNT